MLACRRECHSAVHRSRSAGRAQPLCSVSATQFCTDACCPGLLILHRHKLVAEPRRQATALTRAHGVVPVYTTSLHCLRDDLLGTCSGDALTLEHQILSCHTITITALGRTPNTKASEGFTMRASSQL